MHLHRWRIQCLEAMDDHVVIVCGDCFTMWCLTMWWLIQWPCGDCFTFYSTMLRDDVLIENNKYGYMTMQNDWASRMRKRLKPGVLFSIRECRVWGYVTECLSATVKYFSRTLQVSLSRLDCKSRCSAMILHRTTFEWKQTPTLHCSATFMQ